MLQSSEDAPRFLAEGRTLFGPGWRAVSSFDDIENENENENDDDEEGDMYESEEEEIYVTMDLGTTIDSKALQTETQYQLIGLDTPLPFIKIGNQIFQGEVTPLIGTEVILGLIRDHENPHQPSHPPQYSTSHRISFRGVTLAPRTAANAANANNVVPTSPSTSAAAAALAPTPALAAASPLKESQSPEKGLGPSSEAGPSTPRQVIIPRPPPEKSNSARPWRYRPKVIIGDPAELALLDLKNMPQGLRIGLTPEMGQTLNLAPTTAEDDDEPLVVLTKSELERAMFGRPERGKGSRGPRGGIIKTKSRSSRKSTSKGLTGINTEETKTEGAEMDVFRQADVRATEGAAPGSVVADVNEGDSGTGGGGEDVDMAVDDDDPPWQEIGHEPRAMSHERRVSQNQNSQHAIADG